MLTISQIEKACNQGEDLKVRITYLPKGTSYYVVALPMVKQEDGGWVKGVGFSEFSYGSPDYIRIDGQLDKFSLLE